MPSANPTRVALTLLFLGTVAACNENDAQARLAEARRLTADLVAQFIRSTNAADRAVMADTDEAAARFAKDAQVASETVQTDAAALEPIFRSLGDANETSLLQEFERRFAAYRTLDGNILALAVEGTNVKAQRLSFGVAQEAADALRDSLNGLAPVRPADTWRVKALAAAALASAREIQVLQAPHIAEADDAAMTRLEMRMTCAEASAREALTNLGPLVSSSTRPQIAGATAALDRLGSLNSQIRTLSRRNTNVRALALSLGQKRILAAGCEAALRSLQEALSRRSLPTR